MEGQLQWKGQVPSQEGNSLEFLKCSGYSANHYSLSHSHTCNALMVVEGSVRVILKQQHECAIVG